MAPLRAAALVLFIAAPAAAEICTFDGDDSEIVVRRMKSPTCTTQNDLIFTAAYPENRYGSDDKKVRTVLTGSWPHWGAYDKQCLSALRSVSDVLYSSQETYILGKTILGGPQVWRHKGSCDDFKADFAAKKRRLEGSPSHKEVFEALGAKRISMGDLAERLVDGEKKD